MSAKVPIQIITWEIPYLPGLFKAENPSDLDSKYAPFMDGRQIDNISRARIRLQYIGLWSQFVSAAVNRETINITYSTNVDNKNHIKGPYILVPRKL